MGFAHASRVRSQGIGPRRRKRWSRSGCTDGRNRRQPGRLDRHRGASCRRRRLPGRRPPAQRAPCRSQPSDDSCRHARPALPHEHGRAAGRRHLNKEPRRRPRSRRPGAGRPSSGRRSGLRPARRRRHRRLLHPRANTRTTSIEVLRLSRPDRLAGAGRPSNSSSTGVRLARRQGRRRLFRTGANTRGSSIRAVLQRADEETVRTPQHSRSTWIVNCTPTSRNSP